MKKAILAVCLLALCLLLASCTWTEEPAAEPEATQAPAIPVEKAPVQDIRDMPLTDKASLYDAYDPLDVVCFYVTVTGGNAADGTDHSFEEVNAYQNLQGMVGVEKIKTEIVLQIGDENGPLPGEIGYSALGSNATINVRGKTSTLAPQKSYRIDLFDTAGLWRGQRAIALNKHPYDNLRFRNLMYYELLQDVPGLTSLRTQLVHLYVKDLTAEDPETAFTDYGLYTQVELPNGRFLRNHELNRDGNLYKANVCELYRYEDAIKLETDPDFNADEFNAVIESKTGNDHSKLIAMLDAVNNYKLPIEEVIGKHFNVDNLTSFLAYNILLNNVDTKSQNYLLYSPVNSDTWYFICWDGDGSLKAYDELVSGSSQVEAFYYHQGVSNYWGMVLFNRMLRVPAYRDALVEKMELLHSFITPERIAEAAAKCDAVVRPYLESMPDIANLTITLAQREDIIRHLPEELEECYERFLLSLEKPMPFFLGEVLAENGKLCFNWDPAYDFDGEFVRYDVHIASDWSMTGEALAFESLGQLETDVSIDMLPAGVYYWQVTARNESGYAQLGFDTVYTDSGVHIGMRRFEVMADGTVNNLS